MCHSPHFRPCPNDGRVSRPIQHSRSIFTAGVRCHLSRKTVSLVGQKPPRCTRLQRPENALKTGACDGLVELNGILLWPE